MRHICLLALSAALLPACLQGTSSPDDGARFELRVAPLELPGITDVTYNVTVVTATSDTVWQRTLTASAFGDGQSLSFVGPCDASPLAQPNRVDLDIIEILGPGGQPLAPDSWVDPTANAPLSRSLTCQANEDVRVTFDITVARAAGQGFFDIAVAFDEIYCSAKADCVDDQGGQLTLVHDLNGVRQPSYIAAFACTSGEVGGEVSLYLGEATVDCNGTVASPPLDQGPGNLYSTASPAPDPLEQTIVFAGQGNLDGGAGALPWLHTSVALALDAAATGPCTLTVAATASSTPFDNGTAPHGWPYIQVTLPMLDANSTRACTQHPLGGAGGVVATQYATDATPGPFAYLVSAAGAGATISCLAGGCNGLECGFDACGNSCGTCSASYASCAAIKDASLSQGDGSYWIDPDGGGGAQPAFQVYCQMSEEPARTYVDLPAQSATQNFSHFDPEPAPPARGCGTSGSTDGGARVTYQRLRIAPSTMTVDTTDQTFATTSGSTLVERCGATPGTDVYLGSHLRYADAWDCDNDSPQIDYGTGNIDLTGTPFSVTLDSVFQGHGWMPTGSVTFSADRKVADLTGGGFCGGYRATTLKLAVDTP